MKKKKSVKKLSWRDIHHGAFVDEGRLVAFPTCFPGASIPIVADESHITALDVNAEGDVYGGTSGKACHFFVGMFRGVTGAVFDMGKVEKASHCASILCGEKNFAAFVNDTSGGRIVSRRFQGLPFDLIQEWGFSRQPYKELGFVVEGEKIHDALADISKKYVVGTTDKHLFTFDFGSNKIEILHEISGKGQIATGSSGHFYGLDEGNSLWHFVYENKQLERKSIRLPEGSWKQGDLQWARDARNGMLYIADDEGRLFTFNEKEGFSSSLGQTDLAPVKTMSVTNDGRLFGACGEEISHLFTYNPRRNEIRDLGIALSTLERRRYGYLFSDSVVGPDGEIYFGEDDDLGHLWIYFPKIV